MKKTKKHLLCEAWLYCDENDKSTEFMLQYMQDVANVSLDYVIKFIENTTVDERNKFLNSCERN